MAKFKDYSHKKGQTVRHLTFTGKYKKDSKHYLWELNCDCGKSIWRPYASFRAGRYSSCGCKRGEKLRTYKEHGLAAKKKVFNTYIRNAKKRKCQLGLDFDYFINLISRPCYYCGDSLGNLSESNNGNFSYTGIDRINVTINTYKNNCVPCCSICNMFKNDQSQKEFLSLIKSIYKHRIDQPSATKRGIFLGRFQPPHKSHEYIMRKKMDEEDIPLLILVRKMDKDEKNPYSAFAVKKMLEKTFENDDVIVKVIPNSEWFFYGRTPGFKVEQIDPPQNVKSLSATKIREKITKKDKSWKNFVMSGAVEILEEIHYGK